MLILVIAPLPVRYWIVPSGRVIGGKPRIVAHRGAYSLTKASKASRSGESPGLQYGSNPYPPTTGWQ
nr:MAG TPA_asm: glycerophosphodiester phosphodiesterase [Caudoviricetes sp.]